MFKLTEKSSVTQEEIDFLYSLCHPIQNIGSIQGKCIEQVHALDKKRLCITFTDSTCIIIESNESGEIQVEV